MYLFNLSTLVIGELEKQSNSLPSSAKMHQRNLAKKA